MVQHSDSSKSNEITHIKYKSEAIVYNHIDWNVIRNNIVLTNLTVLIRKS